MSLNDTTIKGHFCLYNRLPNLKDTITLNLQIEMVYQFPCRLVVKKTKNKSLAKMLNVLKRINSLEEEFLK